MQLSYHKPNRRITTFISTFVLLALCAFAGATPRGDAWKLHQEGRNEEALALLQKVVRDDPRDAKAYWFMTMVLEDLNRPGEALQALRAARRIDPALGFVANAAGVDKKERSLMRVAGEAAAPSTPDAARQPPNLPPATGEARGNRQARNNRREARTGSGSNSANSPGATDFAFDQKAMLSGLQSQGVFVSPAMRRIADADQIAVRLRGTQIQAKALVIERLPSPARTAGALAKAMHGFLNLGDGLVVVVAGREVGAYGARMDQETLQGIVRSAAKTFDSEGYAQGIAQIVRAVDNERARVATQGRNLVLMIIGIPAVAVWWAVRRGKKHRAVELAEARTATRDLTTQLATDFEKLDSDFEYALLAENDAARKKLLQEQRHLMGEAFSTAMKRVNDAESLHDMTVAKRDLQAARAAMHRARNALEGNPVDEGVAPVPSSLPAALDGGTAFDSNGDSNGDVEVPPLGANYQGAQAGYALDFFTSQPVPRDQMVPVDLEVNGQRRRVWASRESAQAALSGQPQIATIPYNGQQRAWFDVPQYNPWQDFGSQMVQMVALNMMINSMMGHHHGWGSGGWGGGGWAGGGYGGGGDSGWSDSSNGSGVSRDDEYSARRDDGYDQRMSEASRDAGSASLDSPLHGGTGWFNSSSGDEGASASLDVFGGGGSSGGDSS